MQGAQVMPLDRTSTTLVADEDAGVDQEDPESRRLPRRRTPRDLTPNELFWLGVVAAVVLGAVVRLLYLFHAAPAWVLGDGFDYHLVAHRVADGLGYTGEFGEVGQEYAHHPPGWVTVLAGVTKLGADTMRAHQLTGLVIGLGVILVAGLVGRRYGGRRVGVVAALLAAVYPGFWVIDVQILSEPLGLLVLGLLMIVLADLWERPTLARSLLTGGLLGALTLVRGEELALLAITVAPILLLNRRLDVKRRFAYLGAAAATVVVLVAPWTIHNLGRFEEPVVLSTNGGTTMLAGNCPPSTYSGEFMGSFDTLCNFRTATRNPGLDASQADSESRAVAVDNMRDNLDRLPATVLARYGRLVAVFRPAQTVGIDADWLGAARWPVWAWVTSFWVLLPLAVAGSVLLRRARRFQWPLVAPAVIVVGVATVTFGDPRYHTMADLGAVVLAAVAVCVLLRRLGRPPQRARDDVVGT
jgi:4-amino-4-deoxy-L-arabinose transferase-like glycosyltransferase